MFLLLHAVAAAVGFVALVELLLEANHLLSVGQWIEGRRLRLISWLDFGKINFDDLFIELIALRH